MDTYRRNFEKVVSFVIINIVVVGELDEEISTWGSDWLQAVEGTLGHCIQELVQLRILKLRLY